MRGVRSHVKEVFVSHSSADQTFVRKLIKVLRQHRIGFWYSEAHIPGALEWHDEIGRALDRCDWFLLVLSKKSVRSLWVKQELLYALRQNRYRGRIIPLLKQDCDHARLSWTLADIEFLDFREDFDKGCRELLRIWKIRAQELNVR